MCKSIYEIFKANTNFKEPLPPFESRYPNLLESALASISGSFAGQKFYPTILDAAAAYYVKIACGHIFTNGNKRLGILYTDAFLWFHNIDLVIPPKRFYVLTEEIVKLAEVQKSQSEREKIIKRVISDTSKVAVTIS